MTKDFVPFIDLKAQYAAYREEFEEALLSVAESGGYILGERVAGLEKSLASFCGAAHCVSCSSGTDALILSLLALGVGPGDEVITTPFTFFATAEAIMLLGAYPVFVDIDPITYNIDPSAIPAAFSGRTKAVIPVSLFGQPADLDDICGVCSRDGIVVIEDAAQSFGAAYKDRSSCAVADISCTSFYPAKPLGCFGDGGAVFTDDPAHAERIRQLLNHGQNDRYMHAHIGINGRMDAIQAAVLSVKIGHFQAEIDRRSANARRYTDELAGIEGIIVPTVKDDRSSVFAQYSLRSTVRESLLRHLNEAGIPTAIHYPLPIYRQEALKKYDFNPENYPITEKVCREIFSVPMSAFLKEEHQTRVIDSIRRFYGNH